MTLLTGNYAPLIEEFAAERAMAADDSTPESLIADSIEKFPNALAIEAAFAFVSLASAFERPVMHSEKLNKTFSERMYRAVSILTADIYAVEKLQGPSPRCWQINKFWVESGETFFSGNDI